MSIPANEIPYSRSNTMAWTMYDIANTVFSMGIISLTLIHYGEILGMKNGLEFGTAHFLASLSVTISTLIVAIFMPMFGAFADSAGRRKPFVIVMGALCILFTGFIFLFEDLFIALTLFIFANITYQWGNLFYDAMIPNISPPEMTGRISSFGIALGYAGSFVAILLNLLASSEGFFGEPTESKALELLSPGDASIELGHLRYMFALCAITFFILAIPFIFVKERTTPSKKGIREVFSESINELKDTTRKVIKYPDMLLFIIGWFIISDAVNTVITYMKDVGIHGLQFSEGEATVLLAIGVIGAIVLTYPLGPIADKYGPKVTFYLVGTGWILSTLIFVLADVVLPKETVYIAAVVIGMCMGGTWVVQRQMVIDLAPPDDVAQYFAFSKFTGKLSAAVGPMLFSGILNFGLNVLDWDKPDSYRLAVFSLVIFFILGFIVFTRITNYHDRYLNGERAPYDKQ
ncbi:MAG: MFS transporter [Candidatus Hodarchaeales archaeon]|jgi:UMF1 family MFS transporter